MQGCVLLLGWWSRAGGPVSGVQSSPCCPCVACLSLRASAVPPSNGLGGWLLPGAGEDSWFSSGGPSLEVRSVAKGSLSLLPGSGRGPGLACWTDPDPEAERMAGALTWKGGRPQLL